MSRDFHFRSRLGQTRNGMRHIAAVAALGASHRGNDRSAGLPGRSREVKP